MKIIFRGGGLPSRDQVRSPSSLPINELPEAIAHSQLILRLFDFFLITNKI